MSNSTPPPALPVTEPVNLSIVVPLYNERDNIRAVHEELRACLATLGRTFEIIYVDDGSTDGTVPLLTQLAAADADARTIAVLLRRNYGQTAAFAAGFDQAKGEIIITMDGDRQNDPHDIPILLERIDAGFDVVSGWRFNRQDAAVSRKLPSRIANAVISYVTGVHLHDYGCSLKAYRAEIIKSVRLYGQMHRFIPALCAWQGGSVAEVRVNHRARSFGKSKYGIGRTMRVVLDLMTVKFLMSYSTRPLHIFGTAGLLCGGTGVALCGYLAVQKLFFRAGLANRPLLLLGVLLIFTGIQLVSLGLLAEMQSRIYHESQNKPVYSIRKVTGRTTKA